MVGGMFTRLNRDDSPVKGPKGQMLIAGYETKGYQPYDFRLVKGRRIASGREVMVEQNWARDRGYDVGDRVRVAGPTGRTELPIIGIFKLTSSLNVGGLGYAAMPLQAARRLFDQPKGWMQISIVADDRGDVGAAQEAGRARRSAPAPASRPRARCRTRSQTSSPGSTSFSTSSRASRCSSAAS